MRRKKANIITKLLVLVLVVYAAFTLVGLHSQIGDAEAHRIELEQAVENQTLENAIYEREIETRYDPVTIERIARSRYGLVMPGERIFFGTTN